MDSRLPAIAEQLLLIERELRAAGLWGAEVPDATALASQQPFCVDTLAFEEWLQWILLPRMKQLVEADQPLPVASGIAPMAEMAFAGRLVELGGLLAALQTFDELLGTPPA